MSNNMPRLSTKLENTDEIDTENWGYNFVGLTIDSFIRDIEGDASVKAYPDFHDRRTHAEDLMSNLVGLYPCIFYVRRKGQGKNPGEEKWELTIATDLDNIQLPPILRERNQTLGLVAVVTQGGYGGLKLLSARLLPLSQGQSDSFVVPFRLRLCSSYKTGIGVPYSAWNTIIGMPLSSDYKPTEDQLHAWKVFISIEERHARTHQFCVPFVSHNYGETARKIIFIIDANLATIDGNPESVIDMEDFWQRVNRARNQNIRVLERISGRARGRNGGRELGTIELIQPERNRITIRLDSEIFNLMSEGLYSLVNEGFLSFEASGDIVQIDRKKRALKDLENCRTQNPYLSKFLFDASQARLPRENITIQQQDLLFKNANTSQKISVEKVIAAPDLALIQGPPGTGKTTVIAEICYQVALRGGRTLIASQTNLAVDNALGRLQHNPVIRAVRKGNRGSVAPEGEPFLEDNVIGVWLQNTASDCEQNLFIHINNTKIIPQLLASSQRFDDYLKLEETFEYKQTRLEDDKNNLQSEKQIIGTQCEQSQTKQFKLEIMISSLNDLLGSITKINWDESKINDLFNSLQPYINNDIAVQNLAMNISIAIEQTNLNPIEQNLFSKAAWVKDNIITLLPEIRKSLDKLNVIHKAICEADSVHKILDKQYRELINLQQNYKNNLSKQSIQQQEITNLHSHICEIDSAIVELDIWLSNNNRIVRPTLYKCLSKRHILTTDLIELPPRLLTLSSGIAFNQSIQSLKACEEKFNNLIQTYRIFDIANDINDSISTIREVNIKYISLEAISQAEKILNTHKIKELNTLSSLKKLQKLTQPYITKLKKPPGFLARIIELIVDVISRLKLCKPSERSKDIAILKKLAKTLAPIIQESQSNDIDNAVNNFTDEIVNNIIPNIRISATLLQANTKQKMQLLQEEINNRQALVVSLKQQISKSKENVAIANKNYQAHLSKITLMWQNLTKLQHTPINLRTLVEHYQQNPQDSLTQLEEFSLQVNSWEYQVNQIEKLIPSLNPFPVLSNIRNKIAVKHTEQKKASEILLKNLQELEDNLVKIDQQLQREKHKLNLERNWWQEYWQNIPDKFKPSVSLDVLFNIITLQNFQPQFVIWQYELENSKKYLQRYQNLVSDWIAKLQKPSEQDRKELQRIYLDNANVIGITCSQSASRDFSEEFKSFDVVIIDEVSKCTPPELLIPALKGKKLVLVGDHRQLPPMLDSNTLEEIAEELESTREEVSYLEESLFKSLFEQAPESIKVMLNIQYRMHPMIMGVINQFYDNKLECGLEDADKQRAHNFSDLIIKDSKHIVWVKTPIEQGFKEREDGTSFVNIKEVDIIIKLCNQFEQVWSTKIKQGQPRKEIGIITFYGRQLKLIEDKIDIRCYPSLDIRTGTVDRFQGMEKQVIIVSMVRNNNQGKVGFAKKPERINVAFSRAQELLVIVGCASLFTQQRGNVGNIYSNIADIVRINGGFIDVSDIFR